MASLINVNNFVGQNNIPDKDIIGTDLQDNFIDKYEPMFLEELFGVDLYEAFLAGKGVGSVVTTADNPVVNGLGTKFLTYFEVGDEIYINGETRIIAEIPEDNRLLTTELWSVANENVDYYKGEQWYKLYTLPSLKPAIVDYVYWFYLEDQVIQNLGTGAGQTKKQLAVTASPYPKMVRAWNEMVEYNKKTNKFLKDNEADYPDYASVNLPGWYFYNGFYPFFDWNWYSWYGCYGLPTIYRIKNSLGI